MILKVKDHQIIISRVATGGVVLIVLYYHFLDISYLSAYWHIEIKSSNPPKKLIEKKKTLF